MSKCECGREVYNNGKQCILHCPKEDYQSDKSKTDFRELFYSELIDYIIVQLRDQPLAPTKKIRQQLEGSLNPTLPRINDVLKTNVITFHSIHFPETDSNDQFYYKNIINQLGMASFIFCHFHIDKLDLWSSKVSFDKCTFKSEWFLFNLKILEEASETLYNKCTFKGNVATVDAEDKELQIDHPLFSDCEFNKSLILRNVNQKSQLFVNTGNEELSIEELIIRNCKFDKKVILNKYKIKLFICLSSEFNDKFEFQSNFVKSFEIDNTNFHKMVDFYKTNFESCKVYKSIFDDFVGFENCEFGNTETKELNTADFLYATFMSFINFRGTKFLNGLDLTRINIKGVPNFHNSYVSPINTNRETFRRIKDSFDKVGNYIEANIFYALEMQKLKKELKNTNKYARRFLLYLYELTSNYGQSYARPLLGLLFTAILYSLLVLGYENDTLYSIFTPINTYLQCIADILNGISKSILPFAKVLRFGMEFVSLLFYIIFTSFLWLIILAIKRSTKR